MAGDSQAAGEFGQSSDLRGDWADDKGVGWIPPFGVAIILIGGYNCLRIPMEVPSGSLLHEV